MIAIRVDGDESVGAGHFMRCLAVAHALRSFGCQVLLLTASQFVEERLIAEEFPVVYIKSNDSEHLDGEIGTLKEILAQAGASILLVDSYKVTPAYLTRLGSVVQAVCIDDLQREYLPAAAVINGNMSADVSAYRKRYAKSEVKLFVGTEYCIMRDEFSDVEPIAVKSNVENVLVSTGGADPHRASVMIAQTLLQDSRLGNTQIHVLAGSLNPHKDELKSIAKENARLEVHEGISSVSNLLLECDLAVAAAGTTLNELCVCGVPTVTFSLVENQVAGAFQFDEAGAAINAGHVLDPKFKLSLLNKTVELALDSKARIRMAGIARSLFDGKGAYRVANILTTMEGRVNDHVL